MPSFPEGGPAAARVGLGCAAASAAIATAAWLLLPPPKELPDRLAHVPEDAVEINNDEIYATFDWWNEFNPLLACNAARVPYFLDTMRSVLCCGDSLQSIRILDVGCGGGLVTEKIAQSSCAHVTGIDLSEACINDARKHAAASAAQGDHDKRPSFASRLEYVAGSAYALPFAAASFDAIVCSDVFEHLHDLPTVMAEMTRVLRPGGVLVYDTINRSVFSWYATIVLFQNILAFVPDHAHDWRLYITPNEMRMLCAGAGLAHSDEIRGMMPTLVMPWTLLRRWWQARRPSLWAMMGDFAICRSTQASYLSHAIKQ